MKTIPEIRRAIKPQGYNVKTKALSWGQHATYFRTSDKKELPTIFTKETHGEWLPLISWIKTNREALLKIDCYGLALY